VNRTVRDDSLLPPRKSGWPWTDERDGSSDAAPESPRLPSITIVTPSYNQGQFLEETILSVLRQGYPNLEYLVMDGGSNDNSREIIQRYAARLSYWRSEKDGGQSDAISQGFARSGGEILGWVNSDDLLLPGSLQKVGRYFAEHTETDCLVGGSVVVDELTRPVRNRLLLPRIVGGERETLRKLLLRRGCSFYQPASFWRRAAYTAAGGLDTGFHFAMDYDLFLRLAERKPFGHLDELLACFRIHSQSKTSRLQAIRQSECTKLAQRYGSERRTGADAFYGAHLAVGNIVRNLPIRIGVLLGLVRLADIGNRESG
jgi:glycosyltransferase involved in cell wall biosynthesis